MINNKYHPRSFIEDDPGPDPVSWINQPIIDAIPLRPAQARSLRAVIAENLATAEHLLRRLEAGVCVSDSSRGVVRELWVATRRQRDALAAALRLELK
jgi:hypothetical protein